MQVDVVKVGLVVLGVDLALVDPVVFTSDLGDDEVPGVVSRYWLYEHSPVTHERRRANRHRVNRPQPSPRHLHTHNSIQLIDAHRSTVHYRLSAFKT